MEWLQCGRFVEPEESVIAPAQHCGHIVAPPFGAGVVHHADGAVVPGTVGPCRWLAVKTNRADGVA